ncbi:TFIIB-type zinc ribbon-containing protein [Cupriavidus necator]
MDCPVCAQTQLVMSERQGIEIDYCPKCRGVWLDRGELDKILERSAATPAQATQAAAVYSPPPPKQHDYERGYDQDRRHHGDRDRYYEREQKPYRKKSIWHELFD